MEEPYILEVQFKTLKFSVFRRYGTDEVRQTKLVLILVLMSLNIASCVLFSKALVLVDPVRNDFPLASLLPPKSSCYLHPQEKASKSSCFREIIMCLELGLA